MKHIYSFLIFVLIVISSHSQPQIVKINHYLFPEFTQGTILFKTGIKSHALLNYNALTEEMIFENNGEKLAFTKKEEERIDTVFINNRKFIMMHTKFVELIYQQKWDLYVEHRCKVEAPSKQVGYGGTSQVSAAKSISTVVAGNVYKLKLPDNYKVKPYTKLWLKKNGKLTMFINIRQLKKLYKNKKSLFKSFVKTNNVKYYNQESIIQLMEYLELN